MSENLVKRFHLGGGASTAHGWTGPSAAVAALRALTSENPPDTVFFFIADREDNTYFRAEVSTLVIDGELRFRYSDGGYDTSFGYGDDIAEGAADLSHRLAVQLGKARAANPGKTISIFRDALHEGALAA
jgi:hypothetical protein